MSRLSHPLILSVLLTIFSSMGLHAQTQPVPFNLAGGSFHFTAWDSLSTAGTFPSNMIFQYLPYNHLAPFYNDSVSDYNCPYNLSKRPRFIGYDSKGIAFVTTSNSQYNDCSSGTAEKRFVGSALAALNTSNRTNIKVSWKSETLIPGDGNGTPTSPRVWKLRLQYRIGSSGNFTDMPGPVEFTSGQFTGDSVTLGPTSLPETCNNKPVVQLRWIYYESSAGNLGTRPRLRLDDISVSSDPLVGMDEFQSAQMKIYPNPAQNEFFIQCESMKSGKVSIIDNLGNVLLDKYVELDGSPFDCSSLSPGLYIVKLGDDSQEKLAISKLIIK